MRTLARAIVVKDNKLLVNDRNRFGQKYIALPGGGIEANEQPDEAALREVLEECSIVITNPRLVIRLKEVHKQFGDQYIFLCDYVSGQPKLDPQSIEAKFNAKGDNTYHPVWLPIEELSNVNLLPLELKKSLVEYLKNGFPEQVSVLSVSKS